MSIMIFVLFIANLILLWTHKTNLLPVLMNIEFMVIMNFYVFYMFMGSIYQIIYMLFITFSVCESVVGLILLMKMIKIFSNEKLKSINLTT